MRSLDRWRHEVRQIGAAALLAPWLITAILTGGAAALARAGGGDALPPALLFTVEAALPLVAGVSAASLVGRDPAVELQLALPARYPGTLLRRWAVAVAGSSVVAAGACTVLTARYPHTHDGLAAQLTWAAPLAWLAGLGLLAGAVLRTPAAAATVVTAPWLLEQLISDRMQAHRWSSLFYLFSPAGDRTGGWWRNRSVLLAGAVLLIGAAWLLLARTERLLGGESE